jgi:hypothetical protein
LASMWTFQGKIFNAIIVTFSSTATKGSHIHPHETVTVTAVLSNFCGMNDGIHILATCHDSNRCGPPLTAKAVVRLQAVACWICYRNWHWVRFLAEHFTVPQSIHFHHCSEAVLHSYNLRRCAFSTIESVIK